jgi:hypothetical protein
VASSESKGVIHESSSADKGYMSKRFTLTTNKRGQVTHPKEVLEHCGLPAGGKLNIEFLPDRICKFSPIHPPSPAKGSPNPPSKAP